MLLNACDSIRVKLLTLPVFIMPRSNFTPQFSKTRQKPQVNGKSVLAPWNDVCHV